MNSRSARRAPAAWASARPTPTEPAGFVERDHSAAEPPVASTVPRAATASGPACERAATPTQRPSCTSSPVAVVSSITRTRSWRAASADSWRVIRRPVADPPACTIRRAECPPSRPSASAPRRSASKRTPMRSRSRTRSGESRQSTSTALGRATPRPAAIVSAAWRAALSSTASAAAMPPWAQ